MNLGTHSLLLLHYLAVVHDLSHLYVVLLLVEKLRIGSQLLSQNPDPGVALDGEVEVGQGRQDRRSSKCRHKDKAITDVDCQNKFFDAV